MSRNIIKNIWIGVIGIGFFSVIFFMMFPYTLVKSTIELYIVLYNKPFTVYVDCQDILNRAASKRTTYDEVNQYMNEEIYNNLSVKTKSYYRSTQPEDDVIHIVNQKQDADDQRLVYVDFIKYSTKKEPDKWVRIRQLVIMREQDSWKIIKYIEPMTPAWYRPTYFGNVYSFILPDIQ